MLGMQSMVYLMRRQPLIALTCLPRALNIAPVGTALEAETLIANRYLTGGFTGLTTLALPLDSVNVSAKKVVTII
jgi:hypothetical protein